MDREEEIKQETAGYDLAKIKLFLTGNVLHKLRGKSVVVVLGKMGSGKSTTISVMCGAEYEMMLLDEMKELVRVVAPFPTPKTSSGTVSTTLNISYYQDAENDILYVDTAGLDEARGDEEKVWTRQCLKILFSIIDEIKAIILPLNFNVIFDGDRDNGLLSLFTILNEVGLNDATYQSMIFVMKNFPEGHTKSQVTLRISRFRTELKKQEENLVETLKKLYPLSAIDQAKLLVVESTGHSKPADNHFDWEKVPISKKNELAYFKGAQDFLGSILSQSADRLILARPFNASACKSMKRDILSIIRRISPIKELKLKAVVEQFTKDSSLLFCNLICRVIREYAPLLSEFSRCLSALNEVYAKKEQLLNAINNDWEAVKDQLLRENEKEAIRLQQLLDANDGLIRKLTTSKELIVHSEKLVTAEKYGGGFWWLVYLGNSAYAESDYQYNGQSYAEYNLVGENFQLRVDTDDRRNGKLNIHFKSNNGCDLRLKVQILVHEKDLQATKDAVEAYHASNAETLLLKKSNHESRLSLESCQNKRALEEYVLREHQELTKKVRLINQKFKGQLETSFKATNWHVVNETSFEATNWHVIKSLESFLQLLKEFKLIHPLLSNVNTVLIEEFLSKHLEINHSTENEFLRRMEKEVADYVKAPQEPLKMEEDAPKIRMGIMNRISELFQLILDRGFEISICVCLLGWLMLNHSTNLTAITLIIIGTFLILSFIRGYIQDNQGREQIHSFHQVLLEFVKLYINARK